jgi:class 3 adenylate cyclase
MATAGRYTSVSTRARLFSGVVGERSYHFDVWGDTVNTAARVADLAGDAGVALSEHAWSTVDHLCTGTSAGQFQVKGKGKGKMEVFKVTADPPPDGVILSRVARPRVDDSSAPADRNARNPPD